MSLSPEECAAEDAAFDSDDPFGVRFGPECHWCISGPAMRCGTGKRKD